MKLNGYGTETCAKVKSLGISCLFLHWSVWSCEWIWHYVLYYCITDLYNYKNYNNNYNIIIKRYCFLTSPVLLASCAERALFETCVFALRGGGQKAELRHKHTHKHTHTSCNKKYIKLHFLLSAVWMTHLSIARLQRVRCPLNADCIFVNATSSSSPSAVGATLVAPAVCKGLTGKCFIILLYNLN